MKPPPKRADWLQLRIEGWSSSASRWTSGLTAFLTISGLAIFLLPFSVFNQHAVVVHTIVGLLWTVPFVWLLGRHVHDYWDYPSTHLKFSGYLAGFMALGLILTGVVLTWESVFGTRIVYTWRLVHIVGTFGLVLFLGAHLVPIMVRARSGVLANEPVLVGARGWGRSVALWTLGLLALTGALTVFVRPVAMDDRFPDDYDHTAYGDKGPFAPSLAQTATGGALDARTLSGSASCGTSGCHEEIYKEWLPSAHRYASMDVGFQVIQNVMAERNGPVSTRYCGGCHDPISLFSGTKNIGVDHLTDLRGYQEGISCLVCHAVEQTDVAGNANYVIAAPERYVWEQREGKVAKALSDFLIRAYPEHHVASLSRRMFKTPEFCAACHKQFIDEELNKVGWVQLQNQYDNWRASRWYHEDAPERTIECRECHMPLVDSGDPAAGDEADSNRTADDGKHRSHRFLGGNQFIPTVMAAELEGAELQVELTEQWLRGEFEIPEIADKWSEGPAVPIELELPGVAKAGEPFTVLVHIINNKVGHDFPTGPLDIIQAWIELEVTDESGRVVFHSGMIDEHNFIETGTFMFKAEPVDRYGNLIDRHNLWEMVGVRFKRSLFPGSEEIASYSFDCSGFTGDGDAAPLQEGFVVDLAEEQAGQLTVRAKLLYRKFDQYLLDFAFGKDSGLTSPVTEMSSAQATVTVAP